MCKVSHVYYEYSSVRKSQSFASLQEIIFEALKVTMIYLARNVNQSYLKQ